MVQSLSLLTVYLEIKYRVIVMECPFCCLLEKYIGRYIRVGIVVNCASDNTSYNHIYYDGYIQRKSFVDNTIRLFDAPRDGNVIFTANCDDIFELYFFPPAEVTDNEDKNIINIDIKTMVDQRFDLMNTIQYSTKEEAMDNE
jgi:hypothetical protein